MRVESFSDGVFAFAITLLVLSIPIPDIKSADDQFLTTALLRAIPQLIPYVTSFATIGIIWLNHHSMFHEVEKVEHTTLTLNLLLLLVVAFIPLSHRSDRQVWRFAIRRGALRSDIHGRWSRVYGIMVRYPEKPVKSRGRCTDSINNNTKFDWPTDLSSGNSSRLCSPENKSRHYLWTRCFLLPSRPAARERRTMTSLRCRARIAGMATKIFHRSIPFSMRASPRGKHRTGHGFATITPTHR